jgi:hypothetical protein
MPVESAPSGRSGLYVRRGDYLGVTGKNGNSHSSGAFARRTCATCGKQHVLVAVRKINGKWTELWEPHWRPRTAIVCQFEPEAVPWRDCP